MLLRLGGQGEQERRAGRGKESKGMGHVQGSKGQWEQEKRGASDKESKCPRWPKAN